MPEFKISFRDMNTEGQVHRAIEVALTDLRNRVQTDNSHSPQIIEIILVMYNIPLKNRILEHLKEYNYRDEP
jgi:hypothetical protein